ncbi:hypothetical protein HD806DRAFT_525815 [Xylariaceae sp. AK1471]|nr:hypothetical protein HD806DRAFT_525815 [Xylariaceae sp. AK1471]
MDNDTFDFVIAGGGTAGIALATRLSELVDQTVLVVEAGLDHSDDPRVKIPAFSQSLRLGKRAFAAVGATGDFCVDSNICFIVNHGCCIQHSIGNAIILGYVTP